MKEYTLLLNTILKNANVLILCDNVVIDFAQFGDRKLKGDYIMSMISALIAKNMIELNSIKRILLALSEKSMTQSRIIKSTGLGLKDALNIPMRIISDEEVLSILQKNQSAPQNASDNELKIETGIDSQI